MVHKMKHDRNMLSNGRSLNAERQRITSILSAASAPAECGGRIIPAPARGPFRVEPQTQLLPQGEDAWVQADAGFAGWRPIRAVDAFDRILLSAMRAGLAAPLSPGQVAMGRRYRALVERHDAGGVRCTDLVGAVTGEAGSGADFMDAYLAAGRELSSIRARIGSGAAMAVRRVRPSVRGGAGRRNIPDRVLVDAVCLADHMPGDVLRAHGWAVKGDTRRAVTEALCAALDRMIGYRGEKTS